MADDTFLDTRRRWGNGFFGPLSLIAVGGVAIVTRTFDFNVIQPGLGVLHGVYAVVMGLFFLALAVLIHVLSFWADDADSEPWRIKTAIICGIVMGICVLVVASRLFMK